MSWWEDLWSTQDANKIQLTLQEKEDSLRLEKDLRKSQWWDRLDAHVEKEKKNQDWEECTWAKELCHSEETNLQKRKVLKKGAIFEFKIDKFLNSLPCTREAIYKNLNQLKI